MRVENNFHPKFVHNTVEVSGRQNTQYTQKTANSLVDTAVTMEISQRGFAMAGEMEPFLDTYETTQTLLKGTPRVGSQEMLRGDFADVLADNYQNELQRIKDNYSGKELDTQMAILDKAYEEAAASVSRGYVKQLRMLTGDLVIKPQTGVSYVSEAEAEYAYQENLKKDGNRPTVIDSGLADTIQKDVKDFLMQLKNPTADGIKDIREDRFYTVSGASTESKYGYAAQFDSVSREYAAAMYNHDYATAADIDVISAMDEKYQSMKAEIEEHYTGEEKAARLSELEKNYDFILKSNVVSPTDLMLKNESAMNKLRDTFAKAYDNAKNTKSSNFLETAYGNLANWSGVCGEIDVQLKSYEELFAQFKEALDDSQAGNGGKVYADSLLKTITAGLAGIKEQNTRFF